MVDGGRIEGGFGIYVHWPFCASKCPYCDFNSHVRERIDEAHWRAALVRELTMSASVLDSRPLVETVFFGGGTPSLMAGTTVEAVLEAISRLFPLADDLEVTLEANPGSADSGRFRAYRAAGVNRLSLGVQALDDAALAQLGRRHSVREAREAIELARSTFPRLSFDLITARPGQTAAAWEEELALALSLAADHLSIYQLTIEPGTKFGALHAAGQFAELDDETGADIFDLTQSMTAAAGLPAYEISNHAGAGAESRHNLIYWRGGGYLGIGPGAHGRWPMGEGRVASETERFPEVWLELTQRRGHGLTAWTPVRAEDQATELVLMGLRLVEGVALERIERLSPGRLDAAAIEDLISQGLLRSEGGRLKASPRGRFLLDYVLGRIIA